MNHDELKVLETAALFYQAIPDYVAAKTNKLTLEIALIDIIDALDVLEFSRTHKSFLQSIQNDIPCNRKQAVLLVVEQYGLTNQEGHILRFLANDRSLSYIADRLSISANTVKTHKYAIYRKLGIHSHQELDELLDSQDISEFSKEQLGS